MLAVPTFLILFLGASTPSTASKPSAAEVRRTLNAMDELWFGTKSTAAVSMNVSTEHFQRQMHLTYWVDGRDRTLIRIDAPAKEKGTATLKLGGDIYNYLPKIDRTIKVSAALRSGAWMGSHFTNDDLLKASHLADDFAAEVIKVEGVAGRKAWTIELRPLATAAVTWSRVEVVLDPDTNIPTSEAFFDDRGALARTVTFSAIQELGGRAIPTRVRAVPAQRPKEYTELVYESIKRNVSFGSDLFSLAKLKTL